MNTYDISKYLRKDDKWRLIGSASTQSSLNLAGLYASMKKPVIAVKPGHVCPILPGTPSFYSNNWKNYVPYILNYSLVNEGVSPNIKLNVPLSKAWTIPDGVLLYMRVD